MVLGLVLVLQARTQVKVNQSAVSTRVSEDSIRHLIDVTEEKDRLRGEIYSLRQALDAAADTTGPARDELLREQAFAGMTELRGPGVTVTLSNLTGVTTGATQVGFDDVLTVLNELRAGGAEAIAVNGLRVTGSTSVTQPKGLGGGVAVSGILLEGPIRIAAVGDPSVLAMSLKMRGGVVEDLSLWMRIEVAESADLIIPARAILPVFRFATPQQ